MARDEIFMVKYIFMKTENIEKNLVLTFDFWLRTFGFLHSF